uniref:Uncharacterized protein n=1 Tax=viral metagenome TaxID=1070528 RepID=A0A6C0JGM8_9ZZZZ
MNLENVDEKPSNDFVDKVTLELLMNKNHYNRYLSQSDPRKHQEHLAHLAKINKYSNMILKTTSEFIENPDKQVTTEINEAFDFYVRTLIKHFELNTTEGFYNVENSNNDEDVLFGNMNEESENVIPIGQSFWGKHKVKKNPTSSFPMNYIPRIKEKSQQEEDL